MTDPVARAAPERPASEPGTGDEFHDDIVYPSPVPFVVVHVACLAAIVTGVTTTALALCAALYVVRMFGVSAGYHRYFSHRSFKTSRFGQLALAVLAQSSAQRGVLWWAAKHRHHHKHADTDLDVHSPRHRGFLYAHLGWIFAPEHDQTDFDAIPDLTRYPELVWLNRWRYVPATALAVTCLLLAGWSGLVVGFFWSTVLLYHGTFFINSLAHVHGSQRYVTGDDSRNNWWLAVITLGEGWHNNHHAYQRSTRQGFRWYEVDPTFYVLKALSWTGLVWELGAPPAEIVRNERRLGRAVVERVAHQLAASFPVASIVARVRDAMPRASAVSDAPLQGGEELPAGELPGDAWVSHLPTAAQLRQRAETMFAATPSVDEIVARAREIVTHAVALELRASGELDGRASA